MPRPSGTLTKPKASKLWPFRSQMQKYAKGDRVRIVKECSKYMRHFPQDCEAIVIGSYADQWGGTDTGTYTLYIKDEGEVSWYAEERFSLIERDRLDLLTQWKEEAKQEAVVKANLDWIFAQGKSVLKSPHGATIAALAKCFGLTNLWGSRGEGVTYYINARTTMQLAKPFLEAQDKEGWLDFCKAANNSLID